MISKTTLSFDEEVRKHEEKTRGLDFIKMKISVAGKTQRAIDLRKILHVELSTELISYNQNYKTEWKMFEEAVICYNEQSTDTLKTLSEDAKRNILAELATIDNELKDSWVWLPILEPSEVYITGEGDDRKLSDDISGVNSDIAKIKKRIATFIAPRILNVQAKAIIDLRNPVEGQRLILLEQSFQILKTTEEMRTIVRDIAVLESRLDLEKKELERIKALWTANWKEFHWQINEDDRKAMEFFHNKYERVWPLIEVSLQVRSRMLESLKEKQLQNYYVVSTGNEAAHEGLVLADALLYTDSVPSRMRRVDDRHFTHTYGMSPAFVLQHRECAPLLDLMSMKGSLQVIPRDLREGEFEHSCVMFRMQFNQMKRKVKGLSTGDMMRFWNKNEGKEMYMTLKELYDKPSNAHKKHRQEQDLEKYVQYLRRYSKRESWKERFF